MIQLNKYLKPGLPCFCTAIYVHFVEKNTSQLVMQSMMTSKLHSDEVVVAETWSQIECAIQCMANPHCVAINWEGTTRHCELLLTMLTGLTTTPSVPGIKSHKVVSGN